MLNPSIAGAVICAVALVSGCAGEPGNTATPNTTASVPDQTKNGDGVVMIQSLNGPLDHVQHRIKTAVMEPLNSVVAGTSFEELLSCTNAIVTHNVLDIADSVLSQLQLSQHSGGSIFLRPDEQQLTNLPGSIAINLTQLLQALTGSGEGCAQNSAPVEQIGFDENPLLGTPYEPLGAALGPLLARIAILVDRHDDPEAGNGPLSVEQVGELITDIDYAMQLGLQAVPKEARSTLIVGGVLHTVSVALMKNSALFSAILSHDPSAVSESLRVQLEQTLINLFAHVLPVRAIESQAGQPDVIGLPIRIAVSNYGSLWERGIGANADRTHAASVDSALASVFEPVEGELLPTVLALLRDAKMRGEGASDSGLEPISHALSAAIQSLFTAGGECQFAALPLLSGLCRSM